MVGGVMWLVVALAWADPVFRDGSEAVPADNACAAWRDCYTHEAWLVDLDGDGDLDAVFASGGGYYRPGLAQPLMAWRNEAGRFTDASATWFGGWSGRVRQLAIGDLDGDGDLDLVAPGGYGLDPDAVFLNDGGSFRDEGAARLNRSSRAGAARLGDVDGDGDLDLFLSDWGDAPPTSPGVGQLFLNDGAGSFQEAPGALPDPLQTARRGTGPIDADFVDIDDDWDLDLLLASREGDSLLLLNDGTGRFVHDIGLPRQPGPYVYGPDACDVDRDGDLDLWLDNGAADLGEQLLLNTGDGELADHSRTIDDNLPEDDNEVKCWDFDDDGDYDVLIGSLSGEERILESDGGRFRTLLGVAPDNRDPTLGLDLGDVDGDGFTDLLTAQGEGEDWTEKLYFGVGPHADTRPPEVRAWRPPRPGDTTVLAALRDAWTTELGPKLDAAWVTVGDDRYALRPVGGDLFRADVPALVEGDALVICAVDPSGNEGCTPPVLAEAEVTADTDPPPGDTDLPDDADDPTPPADKPKGCQHAPVGVPLVVLLLLRRRSRLQERP